MSRGRGSRFTRGLQEVRFLTWVLAIGVVVLHTCLIRKQPGFNSLIAYHLP